MAGPNLSAFGLGGGAGGLLGAGDSDQGYEQGYDEDEGLDGLVDSYDGE